MKKKYNIYNLHFFQLDQFKPFEIDGYEFFPVKEKQPKKRDSYTANYILRQNRRNFLNAYVNIHRKQRDSVFRKDGKYSEHRKIKLINDILVLISILIGKNVVLKFYDKFIEFSPCMAKHCEKIAKNSTELEKYLEIAIKTISDKNWQTKYDNGFHIQLYYNATNIYVTEPRYLANITIWEFLYYCHHKNRSYDDLSCVSLNSKINFLIKIFIDNEKIPEGRLRIFSDMRNQLSHNGKLPIENPKSPFRNIGWDECNYYIKFFDRLTQVLVLKTLGINVIDSLNLFNVRDDLQEILRTGEIKNSQSAGIV